MTENQIHKLVSSGKLPANQHCEKLIKTHISWVVLCRDYVYKIKKPVHLSFVDFSTLAKRKYFCEQELLLNQRLTKNMYLEVLPITSTHGIFHIGSGIGEVVDYALVMKRIDSTKEMRKLLRSGRVKESDIIKIARQLVDFHQNALVVKNRVKPEVLIEDFNDIEQIQLFVKEAIGESAVIKLSKVIDISTQFVGMQKGLIKQRDKKGFTRDCHGDLHSGNIFILDEPVIFDCIEFNEHLRQIDILNELAFFCMDLEFHGLLDFSKSFMEAYNKVFRVINNNDEEQLFLYYKLYRANVKVKINALKAQQAKDPVEINFRLGLFKKYFELLVTYSRLLNGTINGSENPVVVPRN
jgi:aminoglycoside phosphotransferase family enzyme